ncbi:inositol hexakisphosphate kinase 1 [Patella vulgata]|uniref:inositol hexakisphosphate kinase 1 n=1 Tax=Patella vulgata TaxID=6465 RepID=UPI00218019AD|nr:inositol hexakisphosphate kinase 1 [Patella vulgata]XP_050400929.1 inositol hexakisphosphate kinase 1 [Patella vulgata]XP_050400930.1 inositol hexakisphosphate kinase 1 [Patella vulgata]XP_050400931.1 inositol hexakisphosphate kinase 1 [Patella vulgata]
MPEHLMESHPSVQAVQLEPFQHQVGGHTVVLHYDETTLCKPLVKREQLFYVTQPEELKEFTAEYRGVIDVQLQEDNNGYITLIGYPHLIDSDDNLLKPDSGSSSPLSSGSDSEATTTQYPIAHKNTPIKHKTGSSTGIRFLRSGSLEVSTQTDKVFSTADSSKKGSLNPWSLRCHKMLLKKWRNQGQSSDTSKFILLENVAAHFKRPCILDLKMGTRQHGDDASESKKRLQMEKCKQSTSSTLGVRVCGMQVYQVDSETYTSRDKYHGRSLSEEGFSETIRQYLHDGRNIRLDIIKTILEKLKKLHHLVEKQDSFRFYSSSLLIMYDGIDGGMDSAETLSQENMVNSDEVLHNESLDNDDNDKGRVVVRMIDFAHTTHRGFYGDKTTHDGPDRGYLLGLENLIKVFRQLQGEYTAS